MFMVANHGKNVQTLAKIFVPTFGTKHFLPACWCCCLHIKNHPGLVSIHYPLLSQHQLCTHAVTQHGRFPWSQANKPKKGILSNKKDPRVSRAIGYKKKQEPETNSLEPSAPLYTLCEGKINISNIKHKRGHGTPVHHSLNTTSFPRRVV